MELDLDTWIVSDTHFFHDNIVKYCSRPADHTLLMQDRWFAHVALDDDVLHLGDLFMGNSEKARQLLVQLPGHKYYIRGNHDSKRSTFYQDAGFTFVGDEKLHPLGAIKYVTANGVRVWLSHYPDTNHLAEWDVNIHGHIHNNGYPQNIKGDRDYRNVSVEVMDYRPWRLRDILYHGQYEAIAHAPRQKGNDDRIS